MADRRALANPAPLVAGTVIDDSFVVDGLIGSGATSEVYAANDVELERRVAIKLSKPEISGDLLRSEGRLLGGIRHPNVVSIHAIGEYRDRAYLVLERLFGNTLETHLELRGTERRFPLDFALDLLIQLCDVVDVLHRVGVVHRDLKPSNIMIAPGGRVVLFDLGVAVSRIGGFATDVVAGTPGYIAPELLCETPAAPAPSQDIYALGCLTYELLTGTLPFGGDTVNEILAGHINSPVPELTPTTGVPPLVADVVRSMMSKLPADRPRSADVVASWLRGIRRGRVELPEGERTSVLVADDDGDVRALLAEIIERRLANVEVRTARDGLDALDQITARPPQVLLLDVDMPKLSGIELCMHLAGIPEASDMIRCAISGRATDRDRTLLAQLGVRRFIDKAGSPARIIEGVERLVEGARARRGVPGRVADTLAAD